MTTQSQPQAAGAYTLQSVSENCRNLCVAGAPVLALTPADMSDDFSTEQQELLAFIVSACNSHAALVEALKEAHDTLKLYRYAAGPIKSSPYQPQLNGANAIADAVIKQAGAALKLAQE